MNRFNNLGKLNLNNIKKSFFSTNDKHELSQIIQKINSLKIKLNTNHLDAGTLNRLGQCSTSFLVELVHNLNEYGIRDIQLANTLKNYDDWSILTREQISSTWDKFRELALKTEIYTTAFSTNPMIIRSDKKSLSQRLKDLKEFFTNKHLDRLLVKSPDLLTHNFDLFRYKFTYIFALMGIEQDEMCSTNVFNYPVEHLRQRHLFLYRSAFYDKPNKKGMTKIENPKLGAIVDTTLKEFIRTCTKNMLTEQDFQTFCDYLKEEKFDNELLGNRIGKLLRNQIIDSINVQKRIDYLENKDFFNKKFFLFKILNLKELIFF